MPIDCHSRCIHTPQQSTCTAVQRIVCSLVVEDIHARCALLLLGVKVVGKLAMCLAAVVVEPRSHYTQKTHLQRRRANPLQDLFRRTQKSHVLFNDIPFRNVCGARESRSLRRLSLLAAAKAIGVLINEAINVQGLKEVSTEHPSRQVNENHGG